MNGQITTRKWGGFVAPDQPKLLDKPGMNANHLIAYAKAHGLISVRPQTAQEKSFIKKIIDRQSAAERFEARQKLSRGTKPNGAAQSAAAPFRKLSRGTASQSKPKS